MNDGSNYRGRALLAAAAMAGLGLGSLLPQSRRYEQTPGAFGQKTKNRARAAGSKLARKAARGKL